MASRQESDAVMYISERISPARVTGGPAQHLYWNTSTTEAGYHVLLVFNLSLIIGTTQLHQYSNTEPIE